MNQRGLAVCACLIRVQAMLMGYDGYGSRTDESAEPPSSVAFEQQEEQEEQKEQVAHPVACGRRQ